MPPRCRYSNEVISVLVADDHGIVREGIRRLLESEDDVKVCGEASDGREVLEQVEVHRPNVVFVRALEDMFPLANR